MTTTQPLSPTQRPRDRRTVVRYVLLGIAASIGLAMAVATVYIALYCKQPVPGWPSVREYTFGGALVLCLVAVLLRRQPK